MINMIKISLRIYVVNIYNVLKALVYSLFINAPISSLFRGTETYLETISSGSKVPVVVKGTKSGVRAVKRIAVKQGAAVKEGVSFISVPG